MVCCLSDLVCFGWYLVVFIAYLRRLHRCILVGFEYFYYCLVGSIFSLACIVSIRSSEFKCGIIFSFVCIIMLHMFNVYDSVPIFIFFLLFLQLVEILPSSLVLFILRKLPPKRGITQYHPIR